MRCDQMMGFNQWAKDLLEGQKIRVTDTILRKFPDGTTRELEETKLIDTIRTTETGEFFVGMFDDKYPLHRYELTNGKVFVAYVQRCIWSSGPCFWLALKDKDGNPVSESLWQEEEME
jgi:hypothetical protein